VKEAAEMIRSSDTLSDRIGAEIKAHFIRQAHLEVDWLLNYAVGVHEVDAIEKFVFVSARPDQSLDNAENCDQCSPSSRNRR
jgi:hypothetical protein